MSQVTDRGDRPYETGGRCASRPDSRFFTRVGVRRSTHRFQGGPLYPTHSSGPIGPALHILSQEFGLGFAENPLEDVIDMTELSLEGESPGNFIRAQNRADIRIFFDQLAEIGLLFPGPHGVALHPAVGLLAQYAFGCQVQQQLP